MLFFFHTMCSNYPVSRHLRSAARRAAPFCLKSVRRVCVSDNSFILGQTIWAVCLGTQVHTFTAMGTLDISSSGLGIQYLQGWLERCDYNRGICLGTQGKGRLCSFLKSHSMFMLSVLFFFFSSCRRYEMLMWWKWTNPRWPQRKGEFSIFLFEDKHVHFHSHTRCCDTCACVSVWKLLSQNHLLTNSPSLLIFTLRDGTLWATRCLSLQFVILSHYQCVKERVCATQQIISRPGVKKPPRVFVMTTKNNNTHHWNQAWNKPLVYLSLSGLHI